MADFNTSGNPQIVWAQIQYPLSNTSETFKIKYHIFDLAGNYLNGWPKIIDTHIKDTHTCDRYACYTLSYLVNSGTLPADLNNDGKVDLVTSGISFYRSNKNQSTNESTVVYAMDNDGNEINIALPADTKPVIPYTKQIIADTNGDGKQEMVYLAKDKYEGQYYLSSIQLDNEATRVVFDLLLGTIGQNCATFFSDTMGPSLAQLSIVGKPSIMTPACKFITDDFMQEKFDLQTIKTTGPETKYAWPQYLHDSGHSDLYALIPDQFNINLIGWWKMDENPWVNNCSTSSVADASGNNNNGKSCPALLGPLGGVSGKFIKAGDFDGVDDYIKIANNPALNPKQITVSAWVKLNSYSGSYPRIISKNGSYELIMYTYKGGEGRLEWDVRIPKETDTVTQFNDRLKPGVWTHVVATYDGSSAKVYMNGVKVAERNSIPGSINASTNPLTFAALYGGGRNLDSQIDDVRIYNRPLTWEEVLQLYN